MRLIKKISRIQVKRCFVASDRAKPEYSSVLPPPLARKKFLEQLRKVKLKIRKMNERRLDLAITRNNKKDKGRESRSNRLEAYNKMRWYVGSVKIGEVGVWRGAGGLPAAWTRGSLKSTADKVREALQNDLRLIKKRSSMALPGILRISLDLIQKDQYLLPIVLPGGTVMSARKGCKKMKYDIDDGSMRSISLAVSGRKAIKAYIGKKR